MWKLKKALYGLKQAARKWHKALVELLSEIGFDRCHSDPALFVSRVGKCFIFLWVDDLLIFSEKGLLQHLVDKILATFGRDLNELSHVLGMEVKRDREARPLSISHKKMISDLLERNKMSGCRCSPTPLVPREKIMSLSEDPTQEKASVSDHKRFMKAVGSIQYRGAVTRPDIAYAAHTLAKHMAGSAAKHRLAVQYVLRYLQSTIDVVLTFNGSGNESVVDVYSDADFANGVSLKSVSGMVLRMYGNCVFWRCKRQDIIAGDTTEAELIAMSSAANEVMWIKMLCTDLNITAKKPTLQGDNKSANLLAVNPISSDRSKHIRVRHLRVREYVEHEEMNVQWVGTKEMLADGFTKTLPGPALSDRFT